MSDAQSRNELCSKSTLQYQLSADVRDGKSCSEAIPSERITMKALEVLDQGNTTYNGESHTF